MAGGALVAWGLLFGFVIGVGIAIGVSSAPGPGAGGSSPVTRVIADLTDTTDCSGAPLAERAAQTLVVGLPGVTDPDDPLVEEVLDVGVGGVLLTETNVVDEYQVRRLVRTLRTGSKHGLLVTTDEEPGRVSSFRSVLGPTSSARTLARRGEPADVRRFAAALGRELRDLGIDVALAPVVDLDDGPAGGIVGDRSFSADPDTSAEYGIAFAEGLASAGIAPTAKHFPGHGRSRVDSHRSFALADVSSDDLLDEDVVPFAALVEAGVPLVMVNHVAYTGLDPTLPASLAPAAYRLLRELGFQGVAITDSTGMGAVHRTWDFGTSAVMAVQAGADAVLTTNGAHAAAMRDALVAAAESGELARDRLDEAAGRMLALKGVDPQPVVCRGVAPVPALGPRVGQSRAQPRLRATASRQRAWRASASAGSIPGSKRRSSSHSSASSSVEPHTPAPRPAR